MQAHPTSECRATTDHCPLTTPPCHCGGVDPCEAWQGYHPNLDPNTNLCGEVVAGSGHTVCIVEAAHGGQGVVACGRPPTRTFTPHHNPTTFQSPGWESPSPSPCWEGGARAAGHERYPHGAEALTLTLRYGTHLARTPTPTLPSRVGGSVLCRLSMVKRPDSVEGQEQGQGQ